MSEQTNEIRRKLLKWIPPMVVAVTLPAHAQTSPSFPPIEDLPPGIEQPTEPAPRKEVEEHEDKPEKDDEHEREKEDDHEEEKEHDRHKDDD